MQSLRVELGDRSYPIYIGRGLLDDPSLLAAHIDGKQVVLVTNDTVAPLYLQRLREAVGERQLITEIVLPDGEQYKNLDTLSLIFDRVMADNHNRSTTFIALGGGVVGDMTGFAAACYQRGVNFIQVPTTLLSQVDSSVGGKTAVNHPMGKNMIGAFYQPQSVLIDIATLESLPPREFSAGLAEVLKYGLIRDEPFYRWLCDNVDNLLKRDESSLAQAIERSCACKASVVAEDEREGGVRAILNLGHTFGHAIETGQGYGKWLHGEAVATGMLLAMQLSAMRGWIAAEEVARFRLLLEEISLPVSPPADMSDTAFLTLMGRDKKVIDGSLRLILLRAMGSAVVVDDVSNQEIRDVLQWG